MRTIACGISPRIPLLSPQARKLIEMMKVRILPIAKMSRIPSQMVPIPRTPGPSAESSPVADPDDPDPGNVSLPAPSGAEPLPASSELANTPPVKRRPVPPPPQFPATPAKTITNPEQNLEDLEACFGLSPPSVEGIELRRRHYRDLRVGPSLYKWMVCGITPGSPPGDSRPTMADKEINDEEIRDKIPRPTTPKW